ncbi:MAG TPA: helix-turn-helix transcriptional regulator [Puia sp.]|jgi:transcriptional regulator with XRE-family HTH domain
MVDKKMGDKLKRIREAKRVTLKDVGDALGMGITTYASKEKRGSFTEAEFAKILKKLGMTYTQFDEFKGNSVKGIELSLPETLLVIEAKQDIILSAVAEILSKQTGQSVVGTLNDLTKAVKERYELRISELMKSGQ